MKKLFSMMCCAIPLILSGCARSITQANVRWSALTNSEQQAIIEVSTHFGDANPKVVKITQEVTETNQPMYFVWLNGHFHEGNVQSTDMSFSILADGSKAWAITNKSGSFQDQEELSLH